MYATGRLQLLSSAVVLAAAAFVLAGCGGGGGGATAHEIIIDLVSEGPSGTTGTVSLSSSGNQTNILIDALVPSGGGRQGGAIYAGTCDNLGDKTDELPPLEEGSGALTLDRDLQELLDTPHAVAVTKAPGSDEVIACGDIKA